MRPITLPKNLVNSAGLECNMAVDEPRRSNQLLWFLEQYCLCPASPLLGNGEQKPESSICSSRWQKVWSAVWNFPPPNASTRKGILLVTLVVFGIELTAAPWKSSHQRRAGLRPTGVCILNLRLERKSMKLAAKLLICHLWRFMMYFHF